MNKVTIFEINMFWITNKLVTVINGTIKKNTELQSIPPLHHSMNLTAKLATQILCRMMQWKAGTFFQNWIHTWNLFFSCTTGVPSVKVKSAFPFLVQTSQVSSWKRVKQNSLYMLANYGGQKAFFLLKNLFCCTLKSEELQLVHPSKRGRYTKKTL